jgi:pimeloyl-ACP methyl ester carboxylesterase
LAGGVVFESRSIEAVGDAMGANGSFRWTLVGASIGAASAVALATTTTVYLAPQADRRRYFAKMLIVSAAVLTTAGGVLAYELSTKQFPAPTNSPTNLGTRPPPAMITWGGQF